MANNDSPADSRSKPEIPDHSVANALNPRAPTLKSVLAYKGCDYFSGCLLCFAVVFTPWAFGTTQPWSIWTMNFTGYTLGLALLCKLFIINRKHYKPPQWTDTEAGLTYNKSNLGMGILTVVLLGYCLVSAINARSSYEPATMQFQYLSHVKWLPHSYDRARTLQVFANYLALACFFWAARDWLMGKTANESRAASATGSVSHQTYYLPGRLRLLLWILSVNGALIGIESIAQRLSGTNKLLWFMPTRINADAESQFGPYPYRGNAAQYFNLLWPVALAFWWTLRREIRHRLNPGDSRRKKIVVGLLAAVLIMIACPVITLSRGGALVAFGNMAVVSIMLVFALRRQHPLMRFGVILFFSASAAIGLWFSWDELGTRLKDSGEGLRNREATFEIARQIARDFPVFGTGPGTFEPVFQFYRSSEDEYWPTQLHNDWLETRITFGWAGSILIALLFLLTVTRWFFGRGIRTGWRFTTLLWLGLAGCLVHALYDFPFQIYSILLVFLMVCAVLSTLCRQRSESGHD